MRNKYNDIAAQLRRNIENNVYTGRLPSERKWAVEFKTMQVTIRKAIDHFKNNWAVLHLCHRQGIYVAPK